MDLRRLPWQLFAAVMAAGVLVACAAGGSVPPLSSASMRIADPSLVVPKLPAADRGRRARTAPVRALLVLRRIREAELVRFVDALSDPRSPQFRRFLSPQAFAARFAPTPRVQARVIAALRARGFTIVATSEDRTLIEASAPAAAAESFFSTQIHDFVQGAYGLRYANVRPLHVPRSIASLVRDVELNTIVYSRAAEIPQAVPTVQVIQNGGFENGIHHWTACGKVVLSREHPFQGKYSALIGSLSPTAGNPKGFDAICQQVTIPHNATLRARTYSITNIKQIKSFGYQEIGFMRSPGRVALVLRKALIDSPHWKPQSWSLDSLEGKTLYLFFAVDGRGQKNYYDSMFVDDVSMTGIVPTPTPSTSPTPVGPGPGTPLSGPTFGPSGGWAPRGIADGVDLPVQHGYDGRGTTVGILTNSTILSADLSAFLSENGITRGGTVRAVQVGPSPPANDPTEGMLDVETVAALAPFSNVVDYELPDFSNTYILTGYQRAINDNAADVVEASFGECETDDPSFDDAVEQQAISAAAIGMTFVAASGDEGAACYSATQTHNVNGVAVPGSNPHVLAVGGNDSDATIGVANPVVWNGNNGFFIGASGGGVSSLWGLPSYQVGLHGAASATNRNVPDISFPAVDADLHLDGTDKTVGGTSWSGAIAAADVAESVEICGRLGWIDPALYAAFAKLGEGTSFVDVTSGDNHYVSFPTFYTAAAGYDNASGIGIPKGLSFAAALCGKTSTLVRAGRR